MECAVICSNSSRYVNQVGDDDDDDDISIFIKMIVQICTSNWKKWQGVFVNCSAKKDNWEEWNNTTITAPTYIHKNCK